MVYSVFSGESSRVFWLCYLGMILIGIGAIKRDEVLIKSQLNILTIPLIIWTLDFIIIILSGNSFLNTSNYFFELRPFAKIISLEHLFLIPAGVACLFLANKTNQKSRITGLISFIQVIFILVLTRLLTSPAENVNCVFESCVSLIPQTKFYFPSLFLISAAIILITNYFLNYVVIRK